MSELSAIYGHRRRQVLFVLVIGFFGVVMAVTMTAYLPGYMNSMTAADAGGVHLVAQSVTLGGPNLTFFVAHSTDGSTFGEPSVRSGAVAGVTAKGEWLYLLFRDGAVARLVDETWSPVAAKPLWPVLGIATVDDQITAFGQNREHTKILTATLDNDTWRPGAGFHHQGDNIAYVQGVSSAGTNYLVWVEYQFRDDAPTQPGKTGKKKLDLRDLVEVRLHVGKLTEDRLEVLPSRAFNTPFGMTGVGDEHGVHVFFQEVKPGFGARPNLDSRLQLISFQHGKWSEVRTLEQSGRRWVHTADFTAAIVGGQTFLYTFDYWFGILYTGLYGAQLRDDELSEKFLVLPPTNEDLRVEVLWTVSAIMASFVAAGGLAALLKLRALEGQKSPLAGLPLYATVTDRAAAAGFDLTLVYLVAQVFTREAALMDFWVLLVGGFVVYGTLMELMYKGRTVGKMLLGLRVLETTGEPPRLAATVRRNLFKFFEMITVGVAVCLMTRRFQRPGDLLAGTVVVKELRMPRRLNGQ